MYRRVIIASFLACGLPLSFGHAAPPAPPQAAVKQPPAHPPLFADVGLQLPPGEPSEPGRAEFLAYLKTGKTPNFLRVSEGDAGDYSKFALVVASAKKGFAPAYVLAGLITMPKQGDANATDAYNTAVNAFLQAANRHNPDGAFLASLHLVDAKGVIKKLKFSKAQVASHTLNLFYYGLAYGSAIAADGLCTSTGNDNQAQVQKIYIYCSLAVVRGMKSDSATVDKAKLNLSPADVQKLDAQVAAFDADPAKMEKWLRAGAPAIGAPAAKGTDGGSGGVAEAPGAPSNDLITGLFRETVHSISARVARGNKESRDLTKDLDIFGSARENLDNAMVNKINSVADNTVLSVRRKVNYEGVWNVEVGYRFRGTDQTGMFKMLMRQEGGRWICHLPDLERVTGVNLPTLDQLMQPAH